MKTDLAYIFREILKDKGNCAKKIRFLNISFMILFIVVNIVLLFNRFSLTAKRVDMVSDNNYKYNSVIVQNNTLLNKLKSKMSPKIEKKSRNDLFSCNGDWLVIDYSEDKKSFSDFYLDSILNEDKFSIDKINFQQFGFDIDNSLNNLNLSEMYSEYTESGYYLFSGDISSLVIKEFNKLCLGSSEDPFFIYKDYNNYGFFIDKYTADEISLTKESKVSFNFEEKAFSIDHEKNGKKIYRMDLSGVTEYCITTLNKSYVWENKSHIKDTPSGLDKYILTKEKIGIIKGFKYKVLDRNLPYFSDFYLYGILPFDMLLMKRFFAFNYRLIDEMIEREELFVSKDKNIIFFKENSFFTMEHLKKFFKEKELSDDYYPQKKLFYDNNILRKRSSIFLPDKIIANNFIDSLSRWHYNGFYTNIAKLQKLKKDVNEFNLLSETSYYSYIVVNILIISLTILVMNAFLIAYTRKEISYILIHRADLVDRLKQYFTSTNTFKMFLVLKTIWITIFLIFGSYSYITHRIPMNEIMDLLFHHIYIIVIELLFCWLAVNVLINRFFIKEFVRADNNLYSILKGN
ncbi:MAG: hypothetical protein CR982_10160 [Candidatus Cloacimonadota bacterium]|nr:MAG: hypothetical protein CR982_10160 [Candidatus Cloacimonadota bacterium]PIE78517.1 MAG: hypothetical protein CSA15_07430 [Candidatus Delongbacteria bacterium]